MSFYARTILGSSLMAASTIGFCIAILKHWDWVKEYWTFISNVPIQQFLEFAIPAIIFMVGKSIYGGPLEKK